MIPPHPSLAVLFGAVHHAYDPSALRSRRSRFTYGCSTNMPAKPGDRADYRTTNSDGEPHTSNRFSIFVSTNDAVEVNEEIVQDYLPHREKSREVVFTLYRTSDRAPRYVTEDGVVKVGRIRVPIPSSAMKLPRTKRKIYVAMRFGGTQIAVRAWVGDDRQTVDTTLEFDPTW